MRCCEQSWLCGAVGVVVALDKPVMVHLLAHPILYEHEGSVWPCVVARQPVGCWECCAYTSACLWPSGSAACGAGMCCVSHLKTEGVGCCMVGRVCGMLACPRVPSILDGTIPSYLVVQGCRAGGELVACFWLPLSCPSVFRFALVKLWCHGAGAHRIFVFELARVCAGAALPVGYRLGNEVVFRDAIKRPWFWRVRVSGV